MESTAKFGEGQQHCVATTPQECPRSGASSVDWPSDAAAVERPAPDVIQEAKGELSLTSDHSEIFILSPTIPARSPRRLESTAQPIEEVQ